MNQSKTEHYTNTERIVTTKDIISDVQYQLKHTNEIVLKNKKLIFYMFLFLFFFLIAFVVLFLYFYFLIPPNVCPSQNYIPSYS